MEGQGVAPCAGAVFVTAVGANLHGDVGILSQACQRENSVIDNDEVILVAVHANLPFRSRASLEPVDGGSVGSNAISDVGNGQTDRSGASYCSGEGDDVSEC